MLCGSLDGKGVWGRMDTLICTAESLRCLGENGYMDMHGWVPSLFTWNYHNTFMGYTPNTKLKTKNPSITPGIGNCWSREWALQGRKQRCPRPAGSTSPGNAMEMQIPSSPPQTWKLTGGGGVPRGGGGEPSNLDTNASSRLFWCPLRGENHCSPPTPSNSTSWEDGSVCCPTWHVT